MSLNLTYDNSHLPYDEYIYQGLASYDEHNCYGFCNKRSNQNEGNFSQVTKDNTTTKFQKQSKHLFRKIILDSVRFLKTNNPDDSQKEIQEYFKVSNIISQNDNNSTNHSVKSDHSRTIKKN